MTNRWYFSYFSQKTGSDISCKLSPLETICMKCRILFYRKKKRKKIFHNVVCWNVYQNAMRSNKKRLLGFCLMTHQPFWVILSCVGEKEEKKIEEECTTKTTIKLWDQGRHRSACKFMQSDQSLLITYAFYSLHAIQRGINENSYHTGWCTGWSEYLLVTQVLL